MRHAPTWHAELDIMAKHGVLPHVIIVFGRPFWDWAWQAYLIDVEGAGVRHKLALLGVRHPAARASSKSTPEWLLSLPDVRRLLRFG